jgi:hypothetical protein
MLKQPPGGHFEFPILTKLFSPNSFPDILSHLPTPMLNFKRIHQHLQLVEQE